MKPRRDCASVLPQDIEQALLEAMSEPAPSPVPAGLRAAVLARARGDARPAIDTVRRDEARWERLADGIQRCLLNAAPGTRTWLVRLAAGHRIAAHDHRGDEECLVLEGTVMLSGMLMGPGDYQVARAGSRHPDITTETGCVLLIRATS